MDKIKVPNIDLGEIDDIVEAMVERIHNDSLVMEELSRLQISEVVLRKNIGTIIDYQENLHACANCPGVENCQKPYPLLQMELVVDGDRIDRQFKPCEKILEKLDLDKRFFQSDFPNEWKSISFKKIDLHKQRIPLIHALSDLVATPGKWLYLFGNPRQGKSFIIATFCADLAKQQSLQIAFLDSSKRIKELADLTFTNKDEMMRLLNAYQTVDVLVLDDFGNEYKSEFIRDTIVYPLLSERAKKDLMTVFVSDFSLSEIEQLYAINKTGAIRSKQMVRLIQSHCHEPIELTGLKVY